MASSGEGTFNQGAANDLIGHRLALLRYEAGTAEAMLKAYDASLKDVREELERIEAKIRAGTSEDLIKLERLGALARDLDGRIRELNRVLALTLDERLTEAAEAEEAFQAGLFARNMGAGFYTAPADAVATALREPLGGKLWSDRLATDLYELRTEIQAQLGRMLAQGASMDRIAKVIGEAGVVETYRGRLVAIARTEVQRVANTVALASYRENADVLSGVQRLATLDSRTCLLCAPLHNKVWKMDAQGRLPADHRPAPLHPRCRCFDAPVAKSWRELGFDVRDDQREVFDDRPTEDTTFQGWLKRQTAKMQREILGDARYEMWSGGAPLETFSDGRRVLTLGELRAAVDRPTPQP